MLTSITPLGERGRMRRWGVTTTWYVVGSALGGAAMGAIAGGLGAALSALSAQHPASRAVLLVAAAACLVAAVSDARGARPLSWRRQVDETWLARYRGWVVGGGFGLQLGFGVVTIASSASVYVAVLLAVLTGSCWAGLAVGATFGVCRALPLLAARGVHNSETLARLHRRISSRAPVFRLATEVVLGVTGAALTVVAFA